MDYVYLPKIKDIYKAKNKIKIKLNKQDKILCAKYRKGHFEGVIEVMTRLTKIVNPSKIFMGEKDLQQLLLVKRFVEKNFKSKIIYCKTIRDKNKLALSSRNTLLKKNDLIKAGKITKSLIIFKKKYFMKNQHLSYRSGNPVLTSNAFNLQSDYSDKMTIGGTVNKTSN